MTILRRSWMLFRAVICVGHDDRNQLLVDINLTVAKLSMNARISTRRGFDNVRQALV